MWSLVRLPSSVAAFAHPSRPLPSCTRSSRASGVGAAPQSEEALHLWSSSTSALPMHPIPPMRVSFLRPICPPTRCPSTRLSSPNGLPRARLLGLAPASSPRARLTPNFSTLPPVHRFPRVRPLPPRRRRRGHPPVPPTAPAVRVHAPVAQPPFALVERGKPHRARAVVASGLATLWRAAASSSARRPRPRAAARPLRGGEEDGARRRGAVPARRRPCLHVDRGAIFLDLDGGGGGAEAEAARRRRWRGRR